MNSRQLLKATILTLGILILLTNPAAAVAVTYTFDAANATNVTIQNGIWVPEPDTASFTIPVLISTTKYVYGYTAQNTTSSLKITIEDKTEWLYEQNPGKLSAGVTNGKGSGITGTGKSLANITISTSGITDGTYSAGIILESAYSTKPVAEVSLNTLNKETYPQTLTIRIGNPTPVPTPTKKSGGGTDTGSGNYKEYPRTVTDGGSVSFGSSPIVTDVKLSDKSSGQVTLTLDVSEFEGLELNLNLINSIDGNKEYETAGLKNAPVLYSLKDGAGYKFWYMFKIDSRLSSSEVTRIEFKVPLSELAKHEMTSKDVILYHGDKDGIKWTPLDTYLVKTDDSYAYYYAETVGASPFGIMFMKDATIIQSEHVVTETKTAEPQTAETPTSAVPAQSTASPMGTAGLIAGLITILIAVRRDRK